MNRVGTLGGALLNKGSGDLDTDEEQAMAWMTEANKDQRLKRET